jgi:hypothetical protein
MQTAKHNLENDNFRKILKGKLEGYSLPVGDDIWNKIEERLGKQPQKMILWPWISGTAAAVVLCALLLFPINDKKINPYETSQLSPYKETTNENVPLETVNQPVSTPNVKHERAFVIRKTKDEYAEVGTRPETDVTKEEIVSDISEPQKQNEQTGKSTVGEKVVYQENNPFDDDSFPVKKSKKRKSLSLLLGSGGKLTAMNSNTDADLMYGDIIGEFRSSFYAVNSEFKAEEQLLIEDFPEVTHRAPLSFGLTVKKELNRTFSLESGLVYTFLDSRFENPSMRKEALLQLHYIGIPLNIQARVWGNKKTDWEVYFSAGGMIEKGIYSHYKQTIHYSNDRSVTIIFNEKIDGLQYSISFAPGIDYKIYRNYSAYLEPKISYYFDNKQPISARTEHPVVIGLNAGLRLCW